MRVSQTQADKRGERKGKRLDIASRNLSVDIVGLC